MTVKFYNASGDELVGEVAADWEIFDDHFYKIKLPHGGHIVVQKENIIGVIGDDRSF